MEGKRPCFGSRTLWQQHSPPSLFDLNFYVSQASCPLPSLFLQCTRPSSGKMWEVLPQPCFRSVGGFPWHLELTYSVWLKEHLSPSPTSCLPVRLSRMPLSLRLSCSDSLGSFTPQGLCTYSAHFLESSPLSCSSFKPSVLQPAAFLLII